MIRVLVIDDEAHQRHIMEEAIKALGYDAQAVETVVDLLERIKADSYDIVVSDLKMPEMSGLELLEKIKMIDPTVSVIIVTAHGTIQTAVEAIRNGAQDYITKPIEFGALEIALDRVSRNRELVKEKEKLLAQVEVLKRDIGIKYHLTSVIGTSREAESLHNRIQEFTQSREHVLILGEKGVGKTDVARMIHYNSALETNTLLNFDCRAIPEPLHEISLFGEERSENSGSTVLGHAGLVEQAHMGTLVISKIHLLSRSCQARLLMVLKKQQSQRVNGTHLYHTHVRVIATSSRAEFDKMSDNGRKDLHNFLLQNVVAIPPLRERRNDIPLLILANIRKLAPVYGKKVEKADKDFLDRLAHYDFPGNYKELETLVESAVIKCPQDTLALSAEHLPLQEPK